MPDNPIARRLITVPMVTILFALLTLGLPIALVSAVVIDGARALTRGRPWMSTRVLLFAWLYLLGQVWALAALAATAPLTLAAKRRLTYRLQSAWVSWNAAAMKRTLSLSLDVTGQDTITPGPIVVLSRHTSMIDTLLPGLLVARPTGMRLRYVLKKELLIDPTLDIAGNRLPNVFLDRGAGDSSTELDAIRDLAAGLTSEEGILIYPEGTRFSEEKRRRRVRRASETGGRLGQIAGSMRSVLPPRPGGTLALLESTDADVVVLAHHGLEGLATVRDIWAGDPIGSTVTVRFSRVPRIEIPEDRSGRVEWLYRLWARLDEWVQARDAGERPT